MPKNVEKYDSVSYSKNELRPIYLNDKWGFADELGDVVIPCIYDTVRTDYFGELIGVCLKGKWGFIDRKGDVVVPFIYDWVNDFENDLARVCKDGKYGLINRQGNIAIPPIFDWADWESRNNIKLAVVEIFKGDGNGDGNSVSLYMDFEGNYYEYNYGHDRIHCEECPCYNDRVITGLCCKFKANL